MLLSISVIRDFVAHAQAHEYMELNTGSMLKDSPEFDGVVRYLSGYDAALKEKGVNTASLAPHKLATTHTKDVWRDLIREAIEWAGDVMDMPVGFDFASSVKDKLESIQDQMADGNSLTPAQEGAVINMREGLKKWIDRNQF